jgi:hypothetical protein
MALAASTGRQAASCVRADGPGAADRGRPGSTAPGCAHRPDRTAARRPATEGAHRADPPLLRPRARLAPRRGRCRRRRRRWLAEQEAKVAALRRSSHQRKPRSRRRYLLSADQLMTLLDASSAGSTNSIAGCVRAVQRCPQELRRGARRRTGSCGGSTGRRTSGTARVPKVRSLFSRFSRKMMVRRKTYCPVLRRCRQYFRCSYKYDNGCKAARQVQQSETDPSLYVVAYFGEHTCGKDAAVAALGGADDDNMQKSLVINFGCSSASSGSPWPSSSFEDDV